MKRGLTVFLVIFLLSLVGATCGDDQTIMRLYSQNNSHVALWNFSSLFGICAGSIKPCSQFTCYDPSFSGPIQYPAGYVTPPEGCSYSASGIGPSLTGNSGSTCTGTPTEKCSSFSDNPADCISYGCANNTVEAYPIRICFNDIFGVNYIGGNRHPSSCTNPLFYLYSESNSHASLINSGDYNVYNIPVCFGDLSCNYKIDPTPCDSGYQTVARLYRMNNSHVSDATDTKYPIKICCKPTTPVSQVLWTNTIGSEVSEFEPDDTVRLLATNARAGNVNFTIFSWTASGRQQITSLVNNSLGGAVYVEWTTPSSGKYMFTANFSDSSVATSKNLTISRETSIPEVELGPDCGLNFDVGEVINITLNSSDRLGHLLNGTLDFGDGQSIIVAPANGNRTYPHSYSTAGTKQIVAKINDTVEGYQVTRIINLIIINRSVDDMYIAGCIDAPKNGEILGESIVNFSAASTRTIFFNATSQKITELDLNTKVRFKWEFSDIKDSIQRVTFWNSTFRIENLIDGTSYTSQDDLIRGYDFTKSFPTSGQNWARLTVEFADSL